MTQTNVNVQMQIRRDTAANWNSTNPVLLAGEWGYVTDTGKFKIGNGTTQFFMLPEAVLSTYGGVLTGHLEISNSKEIRLTDAISGTAAEHHSSFKASGQSQDINYTLPSTAPTDNQYLKCTAAGVLSWDTFTGTDLANLVSNDANNRVLTATGTTNSFNAEANLEFNGSHLTIKGASASTVLELQRTDTNTTGAHGTLSFTASDGHSVASIGTLGDGDNDGADMVFRTTSAAASNDPFNAATPVRMRLDAAGNLGIGGDPFYKLEVIGGTNSIFASGANTTAISSTFGASASYILRCENSEFGIGLANVSPFHLYIQGRLIDGNGSSIPRHIALNPLGGEIAVGSHTYENIPLHVQGQNTQTTILKLKSTETTVNQQWQMTSSGVANGNCLHQYDGLSFNTYTPSSSGTLELQHQINHHGITLTQGKGINFHNYGQGTGVSGNKLDDYEIGTFTPTILGSTSSPTQTLADGSSAYSHQLGYYVKVGRMVFVSIDVAFKGSGISGGSGIAALAGLPFRQANLSGHMGMSYSMGYAFAWGTNNFPTAIYADPAQTHGNLMTNDRSIGTAYVNPANVTNNTRLICGITYKTDV